MGQSTRARITILRSELLDRGQMFAMGHVRLYNLVAGVASSVAVRSPEMRATATAGL
jgi:hypothetical protein